MTEVERVERGWAVTDWLQSPEAEKALMDDLFDRLHGASPTDDGVPRWVSNALDEWFAALRTGSAE